MATRREFIQMSIAASALPFARVTGADANGSSKTSLGVSTPVWTVYRFVVDGRFPASVAAGRAAAQQGAAVHVMNGGDITPFWFHDLSLRWKEESAVIAGVTGHGPLFVLERLAWDHRMRAIVRVTHRPAFGGLITHEITAPAHLISRVADRLAADDWAAPIAVALTQCSAEPCDSAHVVVTGPASAAIAETGDEPEPLFSWLIVPATHAV